MSCESCINEAKERMRNLDAIKEKAKKHAQESQIPMAICKEETGGFFVTTAIEAISGGCHIIDIVSIL